MHRIDTPTADLTANGEGKPGFRNGAPLSILPTELDKDWFNAVQEQIALTVEGSGLPLVKGDNGQLLAAISKLIARKAEIVGMGQWSEIDAGASPTVQGFAASPTSLVGVGTLGRIRRVSEASSTNWANITAAAGYNQAFLDVCWSAAFSRFIAVGEVGEIQGSTDDGATWTRRASGGSDLHACAAGSGAIVAVGVNGSAMSTSDGTTWQSNASAHPGVTMRAVTYSPSVNRFCAVGAGGAIQRGTPTGLSWVAATSPTSNDLLGIVWSPENSQFFAWSSNEAIKSPDGINWTAATGPVSFPRAATIGTAVALPEHLVLFSQGYAVPVQIKMLRVGELDGSPPSAVDLIVRGTGFGFGTGFETVVRIPPDSGNMLAGRVVSANAGGTTRATNYFG
jgi:photosystem II stability/assembly factor-like uncharacterized protein